MLSVNLNSRIVNSAPAPDPLAAQWESFRLGWDIFTARQPLSDCTNNESRRGWMAALDACAVASLPATSAKKLGF